jgi:cyclic pyranopterin phosphate synthase
MPEEGMEWLDRRELLSFEEIERIAQVLVERCGLRSIRLTGGEPTLRARLPTLIAKLAALDIDLALTTNGATLDRLAPELASAGLTRINISLDTLDRQRFVELTKRDQLGEVLRGMQAALAAGFAPVKLNAVLMRGINDDEVLDFLQFGRDRGVTVRFIEFMPLDAQSEWSSDRVIPYEEILDLASRYFEFDPVERGSSPAERFVYRDGQGEFGVIASVTQPFCDSCDRIRLTAEGQLRNCLFGLNHIDLRKLLREGGSDDDLVAAIAGEVDRKWAGHAIGQVHFLRPSKSMSQLGG